MKTALLRIRTAAILVLVTLVAPSGPTVQAASEPPLVSIVATDHQAAEIETDPGTFTVSRTGNTEASLLVFYQLSGTAHNGVDYQELPNTVTIPAGAASATLTIKPINDTLAEGTETVIATLRPSPTASPIEPYRVGFPSSDVILLADNDSPDTNHPPHVVIVTPTNGATFTAPTNILLGADASDPDGGIASVKFYAGDNLIATADGPLRTPYGTWLATWTNPPPHEYTITAKATDNLGAIGVSEPVKILVKEAIAKPVVTIEATDPSATEIPVVPPGMGIPQRSDPATFTVKRSGSTAESLEIDYRIEGTARNGLDYFDTDGPQAGLTGHVTIPAGSASTTINIFPVDDGEVEGTETVVLIVVPKDCDPTVAAPTCYAIGEQNRATAFIYDNDTEPHLPPTVKMVSPPEGAEFTAPADIEIAALAQAAGAWIRKVEFFAGDRSLGVVEFNGFQDAFRVVWNDAPAGEYTLTAKATDSLGASAWSGPVHIKVKSIEGQPLVLIPKGGTWKYLDNGSDQGAAWREPGFNDTEWKSGAAQLGFGDADEATLLRRGEGDRGFITYYFRRVFEVESVEGISTLAMRLLRDDGAVVYLNGREVFRSNMPDGVIQYNTLAASDVGGDAEGVFYAASIDPHLLTNGRNVVAVEVHQSATGSSDLSFDSELTAGRKPGQPVQPIVNIEATDAEGAEISPLVGVPPNPAVFRVTRSGETIKALKVDYRLTGTAGNGVDYLELPRIVTIPEGASSAEIIVQPIDDTLVESTESVVATLVPPVLIDPPAGTDPYTVGPRARAEAHILDNDQPPPNTLPLVKIVRPENGATFEAPAAIPIVVEVRDPDGSVGLVEFFANERKIGEQSVVFVREPDPGQLQTFSFEWKDVAAGEYTLIAKGTDNREGKGLSDPVRVVVRGHGPAIPVVTVVTRDAYAREGTSELGEPNTAAFVVRRTGETNTDLTVFYSLHGTAENGKDYETLSSSVIIPAGRHTARVTVRPIDDGLKECIETVLLRVEPDPSLGPVARYTVGRPAKAAAIIVDNDQPSPHCVRLPDGLFHICLPGTNGSGFRIECSSDLKDWAPLCTNIVSDGAIHFVDPDGNEQGDRFYRAVPEPNVESDD